MSSRDADTAVVGSRAQRWIRGAIGRADESYRRRAQLLPVGPLLYVGLERHRGEACALGDGTRIEHGTWVGRLHFNNERAAAVGAGSRLEAGVRFARLLRESLAELADRARRDAPLQHVLLYEGVTWFRAHGGAVGFEAQPLPSGLRRWLLATHFRLLIWAFAPVAHGSAMLEVRPHRFRITREALLKSFGPRLHRPTGRTDDVPS